MNIKNRLGKLESSAKPSASFCECFHKYIEAAIDAVYDNQPFPESSLPDGEFCEKCQKPVNHIDSQTIDTINKMYGEVEMV